MILKATLICAMLLPINLLGQNIILIDSSQQAEFAISILEDEIYDRDIDYNITLQHNKALGEQAFSIKTFGKSLLIEGGDDNGLMYGVLELAEMIQLNAALENLEISKAPFLKNRGLKFNIPLDARCPSYDDTGDAAQKNIENMWDIEFWKQYFDYMARYRYNVLSLWSPNPFQVMIKLPDYPDLALDDVCRTSSVPRGKVGEWDDAGGVNEVVLNNLEVIKKISIEEKIKFWQEVFDYANSRGVNIYFYTWNIYTNGTYNKYGLTEDIDNPGTKAYYRQAVSVFLQTYPQIKGLGITAGERMHVPEGVDVADAREKWLWETYGLGIADYKKEDPDREIHFVHRVWYSKFDQIMKYWNEYPDPFEVGFKYVKARIYSSPGESPFIGNLKTSLQENDLKCWWNLRNDDIFVYRWGDPDYVRTFIANLPPAITAGYHMGPDGYVFGKVFSDRDPKVNGSLEFEKHWYKFMLWGRLGYDNKLTNTFFTEKLALRYANADEKHLFKTWQTASKIIPQVNRYMFHSGDRHWAPEMCSSRESFKFTPYFRIVTPMAGSQILNPKSYYTNKNTGSLKESAVSPIQVSDSLIEWGSQAVSEVKSIEANDRDLENVKADIEAMGYLGKYYGYKIKAAYLLEKRWYENTSHTKKQINESMQMATMAWEAYADISARYYFPQMYSRVNAMDWIALKEEVKQDQQLVESITRDQSLNNLLSRSSKALSVYYPYKNDNRWVLINTDTDALARLWVFDDRGELVNFYTQQCTSGESRLVWEDLAWIPKGSYTMVLEIQGKTSSHQFVK